MIDIIDSKEKREELAKRVEVLDKVKKLLLIPGTDLATVKQVADFYEVDKVLIGAVYTRHKAELLTDGVEVKSSKDFLNIQNVYLESKRKILNLQDAGIETGSVILNHQRERIEKDTELSNVHIEHLEKVKGKTVFIFKSGEELSVPNRGLRVFPRRAVLRIGMLLRDSLVAQEVRTQLLNIEEKALYDVKVTDIDEEQTLMMEVGKALVEGDVSAMAEASTKLMAFKNRHITYLQQDNKRLAGEVLEWEDRRKLNAAVRRLTGLAHKEFGAIWEELYRQLYYKHGISVKKRGDKPYLNHIKEHEWGKLMQTFTAMCEGYGVSASELFESLKDVRVRRKDIDD